MNEIVLEFSTSTELSSWMIRKLCHSPFSHVDVLHEKGLFGASDPGGVTLRPLNYQKFGFRRRATIKTALADDFMSVLLAENGKPFDSGALGEFLSEEKPREWRLPDKWFCSELITYSLEKVGFFPYKLIPVKNRISPADLLLLLNPWIDAEKFRVPLTAEQMGE